MSKSKHGYAAFHCPFNIDTKYIACENCIRECWVNRIIKERKKDNERNNQSKQYDGCL